MNKTIAFIGCGNMGEALLKGVIDSGLFKRSHIAVSDKRAPRRNYIKKLYGTSVTSSNIEAVKKSDIILLAVKPQDLQGVLKELSADIKEKLIITIAAGITKDFIRRRTSTVRIIRAMPNTPALAGCGITAVSVSKGAGSDDIRVADKIFGSVGQIVHLEEEYINAVTAVSGSGPAYFFLLMEALIKAAVSLGIRKPMADKLIMQTAFGSILLQQKTGKEPSFLREKVTSKGGTTEAALKVFKERGFEAIVKKAVNSAAKRAKELSR